METQVDTVVAPPKSSALIVGERVLLTLDVLTLSNYRVKLLQKGSGNSCYQSIPLDAIAYCGFNTYSMPAMLVFALLLLIAGLVGLFAPLALKDSTLIGSIFCLVSLAFLIIYFATRSAVLVIQAQSGENITLPIAKRAAAIPFLESVLEAKLRFDRKIVKEGGSGKGEG